MEVFTGLTNHSCFCDNSHCWENIEIIILWRHKIFRFNKIHNKMNDKIADLAGPGIGNYEEVETIVPENFPLCLLHIPFPIDPIPFAVDPLSRG